MFNIQNIIYIYIYLINKYIYIDKYNIYIYIVFGNPMIPKGKEWLPGRRTMKSHGLRGHSHWRFSGSEQKNHLQKSRSSR